ncbi:MAG TPA: hypothetical protein VEQ59_24915, partial [Polyangiaceae bacterium]|nr:hypothetical protein [Polyangiaceae bacterium]
ANEMGVALDAALDPWFARALALAPQDRFSTASEMAQGLATLADLPGARGPRGTLVVPGIAAAIAQPLVFQPEPARAAASFDPAQTFADSPPSAAVAPPPSSDVGPAPSTVRDGVTLPTKKSSALPLLIGLGVVLLSGVAFGGYLVLSGKNSNGASAEPSRAASASAMPVATSAPSAHTPSPSPPAVTPAEPSASATPEAPAAPVPVAEPVPTAAAAAPAKTTAPAPVKAATPTPAKTAVPAPAKTAAAAASAKTAAPAASPAKTAAPVTPVNPKKKCSTFLGCK